MNILPKSPKSLIKLIILGLLSFFVLKHSFFVAFAQTESLPIEPKLISNGSRDESMVALTFDLCQSPDSGFDWKIYNYLKDNQIPATFFASGQWLENHPSETQALSQIDFFEIGLHGHTHTKLSQLSVEGIKNELVLAQDALNQTTGRKTNLFRLPYGTPDSYNDLVLKTLAENGYYNIYWEVVTADPSPYQTAKLIAAVVEKETRPGSIIICHANGKGWHTAEALPQIKEIIKNKGLSFVTVSQLLKTTSSILSPPPNKPSPTSSPSSINTCPAVYLCGTPGPENNPFYPYPGSSCYRQAKEPKVIVNYDVTAQKTIPNPGTDNYNWDFTAGAIANNLGIPVVKGLSDYIEGKVPFAREAPEQTDEDYLNQFGPATKLIDYESLQKTLKNTMAVSAIDSQCQPPTNCPAEGEFSPNPIHDYIIAYAIPSKGKPPPVDPASCSPDDWGFGDEKEAKNNPLSRPIRASEIYCTNFLENGKVKDEKITMKSKYADTVCPKLYGENLSDNTSGLYPKLLAANNPKKVFCYLSRETRDQVFELYMPLVSHETEPAEISLSFGDQPPEKTTIYIPHLARLEQLSAIIQGTTNSNNPLPTQTIVSQPKGNTAMSELICPANTRLVNPAKGGGETKIEPIPNSDYVTLRQTGNLQLAIPDLLLIKDNLIGPEGFFRNWFDSSYLEKLDKEIENEGDALGSGTINLTLGSNVDSLEPNSFQVKFPYLGAIEKYYQEFLKIVTYEGWEGKTPSGTDSGKIAGNIKEKLDSLLGIPYKSFGYKTDNGEWCYWTGYEPKIDNQEGFNCGGFLLEAVRTVFGQVSLSEIGWENGRRTDRNDPTDCYQCNWLWFGYDEVMNLAEKFSGHLFKVDGLDWEPGSGYPIENLTKVGEQMKSGNLYLVSLSKSSAEAGREHHHVFIILPYEGGLLVYEATNYQGNGVIQTSLAKFQSKYTDRRFFVAEVPLP